MTLKKEEHRIWKETNGDPYHLINDMSTKTIYIEIKSFLVLKAETVKNNSCQNKVVPYFLGDKAVEINSYQDWWICE